MTHNAEAGPGTRTKILIWIGRLPPAYSAGAIAVLGILVPLTSGWWMVGSIVVLFAVVVTSVAGTGTEVDRLKGLVSESERDAVNNARVAEKALLKSHVDNRKATIAIVNPAAARLRSMVERRDASRQIVGLRQCVVDALAHSGPAGSRSAVYLLDSTGRLLLSSFSNHHEVPRREFDPRVEDGRYVYGLIANDQSLLSDDVIEDPRVEPKGGYGTVVAVALSTETHRLGMLTLDAPDPGALTADHQNMAKMLAQILIAGEILARTRGWLPEDLRARIVTPTVDTETNGEENQS